MGYMQFQTSTNQPVPRLPLCFGDDSAAFRYYGAMYTLWLLVLRRPVYVMHCSLARLAAALVLSFAWYLPTSFATEAELAAEQALTAVVEQVTEADIAAMEMTSEAELNTGELSPDAADAINAAIASDLPPATTAAPSEMETTLSTLRSLVSLQAELRTDIDKLSKEVALSSSALDKKNLMTQIEKRTEDLNATNQSLQDIAAGADIAALRQTEAPAFDFQRELFSLLEPAIKELKDLTSHVRDKAEQKDKISYYTNRLPSTEQAVSKLQKLLAEATDPALRSVLEELLNNWVKQQTFLQSELQSARLQLSNLEAQEVSLSEASQSYLKTFFQRRGLYLGQAILVVLGILLFSRLIHWGFRRFLPGYQQAHRSFQVRLLDLVHRAITTLLIIAGPMVVFYMAEDWLLFSVGILLLLGIALTLREAIPRYWHQMNLFLNVGTVREGERLELQGVPWQVRDINFYTMLDNPTAGISQRLKIDDLVDLRSRPTGLGEPWFPCKQDDWVLLSDGVRGKVVGISAELVQITQRGGTRRTYPLSDFLAAAPLNLSTNFRLKETIGISYNLQTESVKSIPAILQAHIQQRLEDEGYVDKLQNLRVEFEYANTSSLDLVVIADFDGSIADLYNRLRRAIQRWCVEACTANNWEIPFTQLTLNQPSNSPSTSDAASG